MIELKSLEIHAAYHCNLSCNGCMHFSPLEKNHCIDIKELRRDLDVLQGIIYCNVIRILGGEPLLNNRLDEVVEVIKESKLSRYISISSNGLLLNRWLDNERLWKNIDECEISLYPATISRHEVILNVCRIIANRWNVRFSVYYFERFKKPGTRYRIDDTRLVNDIFKTCMTTKVWECFNLFERYFYLCPQAMAIERAKFTVEGENGISLIDHSNLESRLSNYIFRREPLPACQYCYGNCGKLMNHTQIQRHQFLSTISESDYHQDIDFECLGKLLLSLDNYNYEDVVKKTVIIDGGSL